MNKFKTSITVLLVSTISISGFSQSKEIVKNQKAIKNKIMNTNLEKNKKTALNLSKAIMTGKWDLVNNLLSEDFKYYGDGRPAMNKQEYIYFMKEMLCTAMTNMDMKFPRVIAEGNMVSVDYTNEMTNSGAFLGIPATNKRVVGTGQFIRQIENDKVVAEWQTTNMYGLMQQLGAIPTPTGK